MSQTTESNGTTVIDALPSEQDEKPDVSTKESDLAEAIAGSDRSTRAESSTTFKALVAAAFTAFLVATPTSVALTKVKGKFEYHSHSAVFLIELGKLIVSSIAIVVRRPSFDGVNIRSAVITAVPALVYMLGNNLHYVILLHANPASINVIANVRLILLALSYRIVLGRSISIARYWAMVGLLVGVVLSQLKPDFTFSVTAFGVVLVLIKCVISVIGGIFSELVFKHHQSDFYVLSVQMYAWGLFLNAVGLVYETKSPLRDVVQTFFVGFRLIVWLSILISICAGILTGAIMKHLDNIGKVFCTSVASIFLGMLACYAFVTEFQMTWMFLAGATVIGISSYIYSIEKVPDSWARLFKSASEDIAER